MGMLLNLRGLFQSFSMACPHSPLLSLFSFHLTLHLSSSLTYLFLRDLFAHPFTQLSVSRSPNASEHIGLDVFCVFHMLKSELSQSVKNDAIVTFLSDRLFQEPQI